MANNINRPALLNNQLAVQNLLIPRRDGMLNVPYDGPGNAYVPASAADWAVLGLPAPSYQWNCDEASGNLAGVIGSKTLTAANTGHLYQQTVSGWATKTVGFPAGADGSFYTTDAAFDCAADESTAWLLYVAVTPSTTNRPILYTGAGNNQIESEGGGGATLRARFPGGVAGGTASYSVNTVVPMLFGRNCTADIARLFTGLEQLDGVYDNAAIAGDYGVGGLGALSELSRYMRLAMWKGANAETVLNKETLLTLNWVLPY